MKKRIPRFLPLATTMLLTGLVFGPLALEAKGSIQLPDPMAEFGEADIQRLLAVAGDEHSRSVTISRKTQRGSAAAAGTNKTVTAPWNPTSSRPDQDESILYQLMRHLLVRCTKGDASSSSSSSSVGSSSPSATAWAASSPAISDAETSGLVFDPWGASLPSPPGSRLLRPPRG